MGKKQRMRLFPRWLLLGNALACFPFIAVADPLRVQGSTTVNPVVTEALEILAREQGLRYRIDTLGGSSGGVAAVGGGRAEIGMTSKKVSDEDRARFANVSFHETTIGIDAVALVVSPDVWHGGVQFVSRKQMRGIYERRIRNWNELEGPNRRILFFNKEPGRGTWSIFADWLYGTAKEAPPVSHPEVGANSETRTKVARTPGAISQLSITWVDRQTIFALGIRNDEGETLHPTAESIAAGDYPLSRPLILVTNGEPTGPIQALVDFLLSERGQELVRKHGFSPLVDLDLKQ